MGETLARLPANFNGSLVLVVWERPGELFLRHYWLITNWKKEQISADELLYLYHQQGAAE